MFTVWQHPTDLSGTHRELCLKLSRVVLIMGNMYTHVCQNVKQPLRQTLDTFAYCNCGWWWGGGVGDQWLRQGFFLNLLAISKQALKASSNGAEEGLQLRHTNLDKGLQLRCHSRCFYDEGGTSFPTSGAETIDIVCKLASWCPISVIHRNELSGTRS